MLEQPHAVFGSGNVYGRSAMGGSPPRKPASGYRRRSMMESDERRTIGVDEHTVPRSTQIGLDSEPRDSVRLTQPDDGSLGLQPADSAARRGEAQRRLEAQASSALLL